MKPSLFLLCKRRKTCAISLVALLLICVDSPAQVSSFIGGNYSNIRDAREIQGVKPIWGLHHHLGVEMFPFKNLQNVSLRPFIGFTQKGYEQNFPSASYKLQFTYCSFGLAANHHFNRFVAGHIGSYANGLMLVSLNDGIRNYKDYDAGISGGFTFFNNAVLGLYTEFSYGLTSLVDYHTFDELGNFTGDFSGVKHISISFGLKLNYYNKRIELY